MEAEWKSTLENLRAENSSARRVISGVTLDAKYIVMTRADVMAFFTGPDKDAGWKRFYERFPDSAGSAAVSAVGFDPDRTKAIVYLSHHSASLGGDYAYHLFRKVDGRWQEVRVPGVDACQVWS